MKHLLRKYESQCSHEAKRTLSSPCAEGTLHRAKPCFMSCFATRFMHRRCASLKKALAEASAFFCARRIKLQLNKMNAHEVNQSVSISSYTFLINDNPRGIHD